MYIHRSCLTVKIISPDMTQDLISGHNQAFILKKILQQFKFLSGKLFQFALIADFMTGYINPEVFAVQFPLLVLSCAAPAELLLPWLQIPSFQKAS